MEWKKTLLLAGITLAILALIYILFPKSCGSYNLAWGIVKQECACLGIEFDSSCKICDKSECRPCPDAGSSTACSGIVLGKECFRARQWNGTSTAWVRVAC